jgi:hypothetical protein
MSMCGNYLRLPETELDAILDAPETLSEVLYPDDEPPDWNQRRIDIDKSWHIIHFLLNGEPWKGSQPFAGVVLGGTKVSDEDVGYGPARFLLPPEVRELNRALESVPMDSLFARWNQDAITKAELYPVGWTQAPEELEYIGENYRVLREFFRAATASKQAVLVWLS